MVLTQLFALDYENVALVSEKFPQSIQICEI